MPCIISENSDEVNDRDRILDNRIAELSEWDNKLLFYELAGMESDLREMGLDFHIREYKLREVTKEDIAQAESEGEVHERDIGAVLSINCPHCGGYFEYKDRS